MSSLAILAPQELQPSSAHPPVETTFDNVSTVDDAILAKLICSAVRTTYASQWLVPTIINGCEFFPCYDPLRLRHRGKVTGTIYFEGNLSFVKIELLSCSTQSSLHVEAMNYQILKKNTLSIPKVMAYGEDGDWAYLILEDVGSDLSVFQLPGNGLDMCWVAELTAAMVYLLCDIHATGHIHCDIKPGNICYDPYRPEPVTIVDLETLQPYPTAGKVPCGTPLWASYNALLGNPLSRRDDMHALAYTLVYLATGALPWDLQLPSCDLARLKEQTSAAELCCNLPAPCLSFVEHCLTLSFHQAPDYGFLFHCMGELCSLGI
ncbi:hypothetical protein HYDPIDRAFT_112860 [Hydnomerulius pinastri MD-312]|uniref:Protein kinase domain-containing protein n=1 Tax=Hydnomerulius pinastri MD-312 TaxID=994086 RepID=A0A0C9WEG2_9AGAM|nr:hypothetical protein HYDPIDRAFT_112860 [Hydnomerulius pinastri MD-312]